MARALKCDRCGGFFDYIKGLRNYQIRNMNEKNFDKTIDLCPDCYEIFTKWLTGEKPQSDPISDLADSVYGTGELYPEEIEEDSDSVYGTGELYPGEFESRHYEFEDCDNIKGERVIKCREDSE